MGTNIVNDLSNIIFVLNFALTILWAVVFLVPLEPNETHESRNRRKKVFIIVCCIQWILISGLRADSVGSDTSNYMRLYELHNRMSWAEIWSTVKAYYLGIEVTADYELGYVVFEKLIGSITPSHLFYKFIVAIIFMSALGKFIYKNSVDPFISFIVYDALMYNMFSLTGYRQVISVSLGILCGYEFIKKRRFIPFLILLVVSSLFHRSILIFIIFYFLANKKITHRYVLVATAMIAVLVVERNNVFNYVKVLVGYEQYSGTYGFAQQTFLLLLILLTIGVIICRKQIVRYAEYRGLNYAVYYNAFILTWAMFPLAMVSPTSMRLVYDFGFISFLLLIPVLVKSFHSLTNRIIVYGFLILTFGYFIITRSPDYMFFWQA